MNINFLIPEVQILEKIVRPLVVYFFLLIAFRIEHNQGHHSKTVAKIPETR